MIFPIGSSQSRNSNRRAAFTLIELILVMALLMIVIAVSAPSLQGFFKGRNLDSEARRLLSLTKYGQSRAVSEGIPMVLWVDSKQKSYGLRAAAGFLEEDDKAFEFNLDRDLKIEAEQLPAQTVLTPLQVDRIVGNLPSIRFLPDGSIAESSPLSIRIVQGEKDMLWVGQTTNRLRYEIQKVNYKRLLQ
jgi:type II secretion system protein H